MLRDTHWISAGWGKSSGYDSTGKPSWKRDAKQQKTEYFYDAYNRTTQILRYKRVAGRGCAGPGTEDGVLPYDSAVNGWGRLGSIRRISISVT
ncbi:MAG: hypothetical protein IPP47_00035 [Bryobacterales bacterium]|nr:hypothetical protein [Bryobacterales bacterium]